MLTRLSTLLFLSLFCGHTLAWDTPDRALSEFLKFELNGGRLTGANWTTYVSRYIAAPKNYDEPGWDEVTVVAGYRIRAKQCSSASRCIALVEFSLFPTAGLDDPNVVAHRNGGREEIKYSLVQQGSAWLLEPNFGAPHVMLTTYLGFRKGGRS